MAGDKPKPEDPLAEWNRELRRELELDLEGLTSDVRHRQLVAAILIVAAAVSVVTLLLVRTFWQAAA